MTHPAITEVVEAIGKMIDAHIQSWPLYEDRADARLTRALEALFADKADPGEPLGETSTVLRSALSQLAAYRGFLHLAGDRELSAILTEHDALQAEVDRLKAELAKDAAAEYVEARRAEDSLAAQLATMREKWLEVCERAEQFAARYRETLIERDAHARETTQAKVETTKLQAEVGRLKSELAKGADRMTRMEAVVEAARDFRRFTPVTVVDTIPSSNLDMALTALDNMKEKP